MTEPRDDLSHPDEGSAVEDLLTRALDLLETGGTAAVERLLADHPALAEDVRAALRDLQRVDLLEAPTPAAPRRFGAYRVLGELGAGGMGVVYRVQQEGLDREFALKIIRPELLLFEGARERFRREIDAVARLDHPAIVPVVTTGSQDGVPYYVMPRLRGRSAQDVVPSLSGWSKVTGADLRTALGAAPDGSDTDADGVFHGSYWRAAVQLIRKAALGVQHAHVRGVLHRDLKPSNIFLTPEGQAVVLDFGLARAGEDPHVTRTGAAAGSPAYMAPEQIRGEPADERTDVYGLAATLHCLLALEPPFAIDSQEELREHILAGDRRELPRDAGLPPELRVVLDCAMDIDRTHRYPTCAAFADDLQAVLDGGAIRARSLPLGVRLRRLTERHRAVAVAAGMALAFVILVPSLLLWQAQEARAAMKDQVAKTNDANDELERVVAELGAANRDLEQQIARADRGVGVSIDAVKRLLTGTKTKKLRRRAGAQEVVAGMLEDAIDLFEKFALDPKFEDQVLQLRLETLSGLVDVLMAMGRSDDAIRRSQEMAALVRANERTPARDVFLASALRYQASLLLDNYQRDGVPELIAQARAIFERYRDDAERGADCKKQLSFLVGMEAGIAMRDGELEAAERHLRAACALTADALEAGNSVSAHYTNVLNLARFLKSSKRFDEAAELADRIIADLADVTIEHDRSWPVPRYVRAMARNERARILQLQGRPADATAASAETLRDLAALIHDYEDAPELQRLRSSVHGNLAVMRWQERDWDEAIRLGDLAVADARTALGMMPNDVQTLRFLATHQRGLVFCLRNAERWDRLADEVERFGAMRIPPMWREGCARDALRAAAHVDDAREAALREQALTWLVQAHGEGHAIKADHPLYDPLEDDPRWPLGGAAEGGSTGGR